MIEQKIGRILCESGEPCDALDIPRCCAGVEKCWGKSIKAILALFQPAEGELVDCKKIYTRLKGNAAHYYGIVSWMNEAIEAQYQSMIAQGYHRKGECLKGMPTKQQYKEKLAAMLREYSSKRYTEITKEQIAEAIDLMIGEHYDWLKEQVK